MSDLIKNTELWDQVCKTDPRHTKKVNQRGGFTAIDAHYQVQRATEIFGPVGIGWGYINGDPIFKDSLVFVPVTLWHGDRANTFGPIYGGAEVISNKGYADNDALKKASTDGLTKALSHLGFNADVFLGKFDDNKYLADVTREFANADNPAVVAMRAFADKVAMANTLDDLEALLATYGDALKEASKLQPAEGKRIHQAYLAKKQALEKLPAS
jgi:hypothetical protein